VLKAAVAGFKDSLFVGVCAQDIECAGDDEAMEKAKQLVDGHDLELWTCGRFLKRFPRNHPPRRF
jgi:hypothetical protein